MAERAHSTNEKAANGERSSEDIRQNIAEGKENISQKVDQISDRIKEKLDWREYVKDYPYVALGVAAGLGYLGSRVLRKRTSPVERFMEAVASDVRGSLVGLIAGPGLLKLSLLGIATKAAARWIQSAAADEVVETAVGPRSQTGQARHGSDVRPRADT